LRGESPAISDGCRNFDVSPGESVRILQGLTRGLRAELSVLHAAILRKEGDRLVVEPVRKGRLLALLDTLEPLDETFPDVDEDLAPLEEEEL
jgi:hypothetical protein